MKLYIFDKEIKGLENYCKKYNFNIYKNGECLKITTNYIVSYYSQAYALNNLIFNLDIKNFIITNL